MLKRAIEEDKLFSMIFWGPPGSGKTTLARILANETKSKFVSFSAVLSGVKEIRAVIDEAKELLERKKVKMILFVDEIHRFNKVQQDAFLPHVENGLITLIGATTENPSFEVISPLLSRTRVLVLKPFSEEDLLTILESALKDKQKGFGQISIKIDPDVLRYIVGLADGDARSALNDLEAIVSMVQSLQEDKRIVSLAFAQEALLKKSLLYDKDGEEHYNLISALHKSMRGSDPNAALYWLGRMIPPRPSLYREAYGALRIGRYWQCRSAGADYCCCRSTGFSLYRSAGRRTGPGSGGSLSGHSTQKQFALCRLW